MALTTKRQEAYQLLIDALPIVSDDSTMRDCSDYVKDLKIALFEAFGVSSWPPDQRRKSISVGSLKDGMTEIGLKLSSYSETDFGAMSWDDFQTLNDKVKEWCSGLCLGCAKAGTSDLSGHCTMEEHHPEDHW